MDEALWYYAKGKEGKKEPLETLSSKPMATGKGDVV